MPRAYSATARADKNGAVGLAGAISLQDIAAEARLDRDTRTTAGDVTVQAASITRLSDDGETATPLVDLSLDAALRASKPLPDRTGDAFVSAGDAIGFRIMAEAGVLPEEITYKKQAIALRATLATLTDAQAVKAAMAELARIEATFCLPADAERAGDLERALRRVGAGQPALGGLEVALEHGGVIGEQLYGDGGDDRHDEGVELGQADGMRGVLAGALAEDVDV